MTAFRWLLAIGLVISAMPSVAAEWEYSVRPGESLWQIADRYCGSHRHTKTLLQHNGIVNAESLRAGTVLRIPVSCLVREPAAAKILEAENGTQLIRDGKASGATAGQTISMGDSLATGDGFAVVEFADGSELTIRPNSEVQFVLLSAHGASGMVDTLTRLRKGRIQHTVKGRQGAAQSHRISTPVGAAAVRGTEYRVEMPEQNKTTVATTKGEVAFGPKSSSPLAIPAGTGLVASAEKAEKEDLLPAPTLAKALRGAKGREIAWPTVSGAKGYRVTLIGGGTPLDEAVVSSPAWAINAEPGHYTFGVRAIASSDLEGMDAFTPLEVIPTGPSGLGSDPASGDSDLVRLRWNPQGAGPYVARIEGTPEPMEIPTEREIVETKLPPGIYRWQVRGANTDWSEPAEFIVSPRPVHTLVSERIKRTEPLTVRWVGPQHATAFQLRISVSGQTVVEREVQEAEVRIEELNGQRCAPCVVEVASRAQGLESDYTAVEFRDPARHPWPLYVILSLLLIGL